MKYISTRGGIEAVNFTQAVMMGLADDGGLLIPEQIPSVCEAELSSWRKLSYPQLAVEVMKPFIGSTIPESDFRDLVKRSYSTFDASEVIPVKQVGDIFISELFHGPTLAFKDVALQLLGNLFEYLLKRDGENSISSGQPRGIPARQPFMESVASRESIFSLCSRMAGFPRSKNAK